jgi:hypothetical protein
MSDCKHISSARRDFIPVSYLIVAFEKYKRQRKQITMMMISHKHSQLKLRFKHVAA